MTAKVLLDDLTRRLARAKARNARLRKALECLVDVLLDLVCGHVNGDLRLAVLADARADFQRSSKTLACKKALEMRLGASVYGAGERTRTFTGLPTGT